MERIALVDFCGTITDFQTFNPFVIYILKKERPAFFVFFHLMKYFFQLLERAAFCVGYKGYLYKKILVRSLKGISRERLVSYGNDYFQNVISRHLIQETIKCIQELQNDGVRIFIVSAGCDLYIMPFAKQYHIQDVIATSLEFHDGKCTGKIDGRDCTGSNKPMILKQYLAEKIECIDFVTGISDNKTDMPMLALCKQKIIISKDVHQEWAGNGLEEIIWH